MWLTKAQAIEASKTSISELDWSPIDREVFREYRRNLVPTALEAATLNPQSRGRTWPLGAEVSARMGSARLWITWEADGLDGSTLWTPVANMLIAGEIEVEDISVEDEAVQTLDALEEMAGVQAEMLMGCDSHAVRAWRERGVVSGRFGAAALLRILANDFKL